jgi:hypothetical protein
MPEALPQQNNLDNAFFKAGTSFKRAIPGQSLTSDPETPMPFERPPKLTNRGEALEYYFELLTEEEMYLSVMDAVESGIPLMDVVKPLLIQGFQEGLFNPDMVMLLAEPLTYMIAALAERADIAFTIMGDDDESPSEEAEDLSVLDGKLKDVNMQNMEEDLPKDIASKLKSVEAPKRASLLGER